MTKQPQQEKAILLRYNVDLMTASKLVSSLPYQFKDTELHQIAEFVEKNVLDLRARVLLEIDDLDRHRRMPMEQLSMWEE